jgi:putative transposase
MKQVARNVTMPDWGFLSGFRYLIHDRDTKFSDAFQSILKSVGLTPLPLPPMSPNLNAIAERFVRSIKEECVERLILFGEGSLRKAIEEYVKHYHGERNHQGKGNAILFPSAGDRIGSREGAVECRKRLGGLLRYYRRAG